MIRNIQLRHAGKYTCAVQTKVDSVSIATDVVVRGKDVRRRLCVRVGRGRVWRRIKGTRWMKARRKLELCIYDTRAEESRN